MARYCGKIGFVKTVETSPGVYTNEATEKKYYGDVLSVRLKWQPTDSLNDNFTVNNQISIIADKFAFENFSIIKYVDWQGILWKVTGVEVRYPRLILTIGGEYNE